LNTQKTPTVCCLLVNIWRAKCRCRIPLLSARRFHHQFMNMTSKGHADLLGTLSFFGMLSLSVVTFQTLSILLKLRPPHSKPPRKSD
jgi:hypothetical protein